MAAMAVPRVAPAPAGAPAPTSAPARSVPTHMPSGGPAARVDHPLDAGANPPSAAGAVPSRPAGAVTNETPLRMMAQVRDGVAMFGGGAVHLVELPVAGKNALPLVAQVSAALARSHPGIATRILNFEHLIDFG
ncbi:MAG: hypothetical protein KGJ86_05715 [Chloroflexota bacterium]|nr:hypothetical protein [Chloroflexota bacterium]